MAAMVTAFVAALFAIGFHWREAGQPQRADSAATNSARAELAEADRALARTAGLSLTGTFTSPKGKVFDVVGARVTALGDLLAQLRLGSEPAQFLQVADRGFVRSSALGFGYLGIAEDAARSLDGRWFEVVPAVLGLNLADLASPAGLARLLDQGVGEPGEIPVSVADPAHPDQIRFGAQRVRLAAAERGAPQIVRVELQNPQLGALQANIRALSEDERAGLIHDIGAALPQLESARTSRTEVALAHPERMGCLPENCVFSGVFTATRVEPQVQTVDARLVVSWTRAGGQEAGCESLVSFASGQSAAVTCDLSAAAADREGGFSVSYTAVAMGEAEIAQARQRLGQERNLDGRALAARDAAARQFEQTVLAGFDPKDQPQSDWCLDFDEYGCLRRVSVFDPRTQTAVDVSLGELTATPEVRERLDQDVRLRQKGTVRAVEWRFRPDPAHPQALWGPDEELRGLLDQAGVKLIREG